MPFHERDRHIGQDEIKVTINQEEIKYNKTPKILGVTLDESLNFQSHISKEEQKANKALSSLIISSYHNRIFD